MLEKCNFKWQDFQPHLANTFSTLKNDKSFVDVTLMSDDFHMVSAHKVVLSASSEYFKNVLSYRNHSHPLLYLDGISKNDLNNVIDYIYIGKIQIHQNY